MTVTAPIIRTNRRGARSRVTYDPAANGGLGQFRVWYPTVGGHCNTTLRSTWGSTTVQGKVYTVNDRDMGYERLVRGPRVYNAQLHVVRDIIFPQTEPGQQRKFVFSYNSDTTENATDQSLTGAASAVTRTTTRPASVGWGEPSRVISPPGSTAKLCLRRLRLSVEFTAFVDVFYRRSGDQ